MRSFLASLNEHPMALLRGIAEVRGIELSSNLRADAAAQLAAALATPEATAAALATCSPAGQAAWRSLRAAQGRMKTAVFARAHGEIRPVGPGRLEREATWRHPETPAEELWYRGLIFRAFADLGEGPLEYIYIPDDLPAPPEDAPAAPEVVASPLTAVAAPPEPRYARNALAVDLCTLLASLRETPGQVDKAGRLRPAEVERLAALLLANDSTRCEMLLALARARGWLAVDRDRLVVVTQTTSAWLRGALWQQMSSLFTAWRDAADWEDLRHVPGLRAEGEWRSDPRLARRGILAILRRLEPAAWYRLADLTAHIKATTPDFQRPDGDYTRWYLKDVASGRYLSGFEAWDDVEGRLIRFVVTGPLLWLGAVALGEAAGEAAFRLTPYGAAWLAGTAPAELPRPERLTVGEDFIVTAPLRCPLLDRFRLLRFTDPIPLQAGDVAAGQPPRATRHRISRGSLARARASGLKAEAIAQFLQRAAEGRVPGRVTAALNRFDQAGGAVRASRGAVLRVADASILAALRADPAIAPLLGELLSAQAVLVSEANLERLLTLLDQTGYVVKLD